MRENEKRLLRPRLRFPEFRDAGEWTTVELGKLSRLVTDRVGSTSCIPYTIASGIGLISQEEKLGRTIAGNSLKNYIVLQKNDFAYNKSATKAYPQGFIALYVGGDRAAVPNSIFTCFRVDQNQATPSFLDKLFSVNLHGKWLRKSIAVGARAHGSLQVNDDDLMATPVPLPRGTRSISEQNKIADCLSFLQELTAAENQKLDILKTHKKGLMQQLFPAKGETTPRLRFPDFRNDNEWEYDLLGNIFDTTSGGTPSRSTKEYWDGCIPWITTSLVNFGVIGHAVEFISDAGLKNSAAKIFPRGTVLIAMYGQGKTRGQVALLDIEAATNQACAAILPRKEIDPNFVFLNLASRYEEMRQLSNSGGQENLSQGLIRELPFFYPSNHAEQQKITTCLTSVDNLIDAQAKKIETLISHKNGLMQQIFPVLDEVSV